MTRKLTRWDEWPEASSQQKAAWTRKDKRTRKWCLDPVNLRPMYDRNYKSLEGMWNRMPQQPGEKQKRETTCWVLSQGLWGNFCNPEGMNLTPEEIYDVLFKEQENDIS